MPPSATEAGRSVGFITIWCHSEKQAADSPQITGCLFQENKQSFSFLSFFFPAVVSSRAAGILCFNWRGGAGETLTSPPSEPRLDPSAAASDRTKDEGTSGRSSGARAECEWR